MPPVKITTGHQHISVGVPWVGEVSLIQNDHIIPDMTVKKMYPKSPFLLPCAPYITQPGSSAVPLRSGSPSCTSAVPCQGTWLTNYLSPPLPSHAAFTCAPSETQAPYPPHTPCTGPVPSAAPSMKEPLPSYISLTPPPTVSPPPGTDSRPC